MLPLHSIFILKIKGKFSIQRPLSTDRPPPSPPIRPTQSSFPFLPSAIPTQIPILKVVCNKLMAYTSVIETLDRLSAKSVLRGSTSTVAGIIGTLILIILCLAIYIPPTAAILNGDYFETEFYTQSIASQTFYTNDDFKIAVVFRNKVTNQLANHSEILTYAQAIAIEQYPDYSALFHEPMKTCADYPDYFNDVKDAPKLDDCFIFPNYATFNIFNRYSYYTVLYFNLFPKDDPNPFASAGGRIEGFRYKLEQLLVNYYYQVYFTSRVIDADGNPYFVMHRFFSTDSEPTSLVGTSWNQITYNIRNTTMDLSIMPWRNIQNQSNLVWLGQIYNQQLLTPEDGARYGVYVYFTEQNYQIRSFRYYKKVDFLAGIIGGAMLLFYLILWVPFNFINRTIHQMRNTQKLLLLNKGKDDEPTLAEDLFPAAVPWYYCLSNPFLNCFFPKLKEADDLVTEGERELDIVSLIKKLKVVERTLEKRNILEQFQPKVLSMRENNDQSLVNISVAEQSQVVQSDTGSIMQEQNLQVREEDFREEEVDNKFELPDRHFDFIQKSKSAEKLFTHSVAAGAIRQEDYTDLKEFQAKNKWSAHYDEKAKVSLPRRVFNKLCEVIEWFDLFGAKPNLNPGSTGSSFIGLCGVLTIILLTCLTVGLTVSNANTPNVMILQQFEPENNFGFQLTPGQDLKFAVCTPYISYLQGANRYGYFRFFYETSAGRAYLNPIKLTSAEYDLFDLTRATSPVNINYCFKMTSSSPIFLGKTPSDYGFFGFRIEPYCASTPGYCSSTASTVISNFIIFMNNAPIYLFLPENRFDPDSKKFINNLVMQPLNINSFYMNNHSAMEETLYVDEVRIEDDTKNFFMRKSPNITFRGIAADANTPYPLSRMFNNSALYYELRIKPSSKQVNYLVSTPKADTILGIIGGVIVLWYSLCHWLGKAYNNYQIRLAQADAIYNEDGIDENLFTKLIAISPIPACLLPKCFQLRNTVTRMRQVDRKILNDLNYLWLVKYVNNIFDLSYSLFDRARAQHLSKVFVKEKIDEAQNVVQVVEVENEHNDEDFMDFQLLRDDHGMEKELKQTKRNKIANETSDKVFAKELQEQANEKEVPMRATNTKMQAFSDNYLNGHPKPLKMGWMDTFEYQPSLTFKGRREVTSCCGGCCCIILLVLILVIVNFQLGIYLNRSDTRIGMTTQIMQPLETNSTAYYNSDISFTTGAEFKLAVTFSSQSEDVPHNISDYLANGLGISIFQTKYMKAHGAVTDSTVEYPMMPCQKGYFTKSISTLVDPAYYSNEQFGYCAPDGLKLKIAGLPEDTQRESFTLSIYNKYNTTSGNLNIKNLLNNFFPKFHFTVPNMDNKEQAITYEFTSLVFDPYNITSPMQQNLSISKLFISYDDDIGFNTQPRQLMTYTVNPFQQNQVYYVGLASEALYYNLTFDNSFLVEKYLITGDKFYETFGIVGGLIAFFIFGFACIPRAFNRYRLQYLIGRELYLFEIAKKKRDNNRLRGKPKKSKQQRKELSQINNMSEGKLLRAYFFSLIGSVWQNYNIDPILRRVSLIQQRVDKDISLANLYRKLHCFRDTLNDQFENREGIRPADIFLKHIYNPDPEETHMDHLTKIKNLTRRYGWTAYEQFAISEAYAARINLRDVFDNAFLSRAFDLETEATVANLSVLNGSIGTESAVASEMMSRQEQEED